MPTRHPASAARLEKAGFVWKTLAQQRVKDGKILRIACLRRRHVTSRRLHYLVIEKFKTRSRFTKRLDEKGRFDARGFDITLTDRSPLQNRWQIRTPTTSFCSNVGSTMENLMDARSFRSTPRPMFANHEKKETNMRNQQKHQRHRSRTAQAFRPRKSKSVSHELFPTTGSYAEPHRGSLTIFCSPRSRVPSMTIGLYARKPLASRNHVSLRIRRFTQKIATIANQRRKSDRIGARLSRGIPLDEQRTK